MVKKTIKYVDYDGNQRSEDFYFNLNKAELAEMAHSETGGMQKYLENIVAENDNKRIIAVLKDIILKSYGKKSLDGRRFEKSPQLSEEFSQTEAFVELFMELGNNAEAAAEFVNGIVPKMEPKTEQRSPQLLR